MTTPRVLATYVQAIKVTVDGPREPRNKHRQESTHAMPHNNIDYANRINSIFHNNTNNNTNHNNDNNNSVKTIDYRGNRQKNVETSWFKMRAPAKATPNIDDPLFKPHGLLNYPGAERQNGLVCWQQSLSFDYRYYFYQPKLTEHSLAELKSSLSSPHNNHNDSAHKSFIKLSRNLHNNTHDYNFNFHNNHIPLLNNTPDSNNGLSHNNMYKNEEDNPNNTPPQNNDINTPPQNIHSSRRDRERFALWRPY